MSKEAQVPESEPKQKTRKGKEIPVPKREQVMADFRKIAKKPAPADGDS